MVQRKEVFTRSEDNLEKTSAITAENACVATEMVMASERDDEPLSSSGETREADAADHTEDEEAPFLAVSLTKLAVTSICSFGIYQIYWFYENWRLLKEREQTRIRPSCRALFAYFSCYQCLSRISRASFSLGLRRIPAGPLAVGWIITTLLVNLPDPFWTISVLSVLFLLPAQAAANRINLKSVPNHDPNRQFTTSNAVFIVGACICWVLVFVGLSQA